MTVRWKPLLVLSGVFAAIAVLGLIAMAITLSPGGAPEILARARAERLAKRYGEADIDYKRALQLDGKAAAVHEEMASFYGEWAAHAPAPKRDELRALRFASLIEATKHGKTLKEPRRQLLAAALAQDEVPEGVHWAREVLSLEPENPDAHYALAAAALDDRSQGAARNLTPVIPEVKRHLKALEAAQAPLVRVTWIKARLARVSDDAQACESALAQARALTLPADADPVDRTALLMLRALDVETTTEPALLAGRVKVLQGEAHALAAGPGVAPNRVTRLNLLLGRVQKSLTRVAAQTDPKAKPGLEALIDGIDKDIDAIFEQALAALSKTDMHVYLTYADHLRFRGKRDRCLEVVDRATKSELARLPDSSDAITGLHAVAVEAALSDGKDGSRYDKAAPHVAALIASTQPRAQGFGHLFQGAIELERSGVVGAPAADGGEAGKPAQPKLRASALNHLKIAADRLPDVVEAQARYGVALILAQEQSLGRQYLQAAMRQGETEPQYQLWAAWSVVQAGYPEEAEPVVNHLLAGLAKGQVPRELEGTLHLLAGEIHQARRSPDELRKALAEYERSFGGKSAPAGVQLRMAQIDVQLGHGGDALRRLADMRARGQGGTAAEHLAVLTLLELGKAKEARDALAAARGRYPASEELVGLEAAVLIKDEKPKEADRVLSGFLDRYPNNVSVQLVRAQVLADQLDDVKGARQILAGVADRSENSAPLVQLALLDLRRKDHDAVAATVAKIRSRWKEAAAADLLEAQLALEMGDLPGAVAHFDAALKKDPGNKLVQFWKAQIEGRMGSTSEAAQAFEALVKDGSTKQLDSGLSLATAARSALANLALQNHDLDGAIRRFEGLRSGGLARSDRWQLVGAYSAKGQWGPARKEIAGLLNDVRTPPSNDERVRAATYYKQNKEDAAAVAQLDYVLKVSPAHPAAVVSRAYMLWEAKKPDEAAALIRKAIATPGREAPPAVFFLMLGALEYESRPANEAPKRALKVLDQGLAVQPKALDLVRAKYKLLALDRGPKDALAYVESEAKGDPKGDVLRLLAEVYREQKDYPGAEKTLRDLVARHPGEPGAAVALVRVVATRAARAGEAGDRSGEGATNEKAAALVKGFRAKFPNEIALLQEDCELAFRRGDVARATAVTAEADQIARNSPVGPLLRARIYGAQGRTREVAESYAEALRRNPALTDVRLLLGQANLKLGQGDEAIRQAELVLETEADRSDAVLLEARALAQPVGSEAQTAARRAKATELLTAAIRRRPKFTAAYHLLAEVQATAGRRADAAATLRAGLDAAPDDPVGVAQLVELLAAPPRPGDGPTADALAAADTLAASVGGRDKTGSLMLALAVGYHKAGRLDQARSWAEKASAKLDAPVVHLNYGDILLSIAEARDEAEAPAYFRKAVEQYDLVLKAQANSVEAVNNKAWILSRYLGESRKALDLALGLLGRVDPSTLPGEFFDTLGSIQEAVGRPREAEESYDKGLRKSPDHPVLNYHMGKLILADARRAGKARGYLEVAQAGRTRLSPSMAAEVDSLVDRSRTR